MRVDLRSDTVTRPDAEMRRAMAEAEVGDDGFSEDPTVRRLEEEAAAALGKEAALFVPSGVMANQIALHLLGRPGGAVLCPQNAHILRYEMGAMAALSGLMAQPLPAPDGLLNPEQVAEAIVPSGGYLTPTVLLSLENTHNMAGGRVLSAERTDALVEVARRHGLPVHLDGARIFNAALAQGTTPARLAAGVDTVMFCLSKGLGAPAGSLLCSSAARIAEARRVRKMFGGAMRQVGVLAAAGLVALRQGPRRLADDHARAAQLAAGLAELPGLEVAEPVETNIVMVAVPGSAPELCARLQAEGLLCSPVDGRRVRLVLHRDVDDAGVEWALRGFGGLLGV